jgi:RHS repeat-associated protein
LTANNYLFAGEQFDPELGLYYNRARYLDVRAGRFWGMDTYGGTSFDPLTLHKYLYAGNNPINHSDPSGRDFDLIGTLNALVVQATEIVQSVPNLVGAAFGTGTIGLLWNRLGAAVQDIGAQTLVLLEDELPEIQVAEEETIANSSRVIDWVARSADGLRELFIEAKYGIPYANGPAMSRLVAQMQAASTAAESSGGRVVLFLIRAPGVAQYNNLMTQLGNVASDVEIVVGPEALYYFVRGYFGF